MESFSLFPSTSSSGSGFQSKNEYLFGKIDMQLKLVPGNSLALSLPTFYLQKGQPTMKSTMNSWENLSGNPYILHTNVFSQGKGNREQQFYLWFDPTADFHTYSILWNPKRIIFYLDHQRVQELRVLRCPIPKEPGHEDILQSWNADDWATRGGLVKTDWSHAPFTASYRNFKADVCIWSSGSSSCSSRTMSSTSTSSECYSQELDSTSQERTKWVQKNYMIYNYCTDTKRFLQGLPPE